MNGMKKVAALTTRPFYHKFKQKTIYTGDFFGNLAARFAQIAKRMQSGADTDIRIEDQDG
jgi:hypothetical protein